MTPTTETTRELKKHLIQSFNLLKTLRDEIRVELHLAEMEAKNKWVALEPHFARAEQIVNTQLLARDVSARTQEFIDETVRSYRMLRDTLNMERPDIQPDDDE